MTPCVTTLSFLELVLGDTLVAYLDNNNYTTKVLQHSRDSTVAVSIKPYRDDS
jgi:hypothetical protein